MAKRTALEIIQCQTNLNKQLKDKVCTPDAYDILYAELATELAEVVATLQNKADSGKGNGEIKWSAIHWTPTDKKTGKVRQGATPIPMLHSEGAGKPFNRNADYWDAAVCSEAGIKGIILALREHGYTPDIEGMKKALASV